MHSTQQLLSSRNLLSPSSISANPTADADVMESSSEMEETNLAKLGSLCCKLVEATNFQVCPTMLRADQVHLKRMRDYIASSFSVSAELLFQKHQQHQQGSTNNDNNDNKNTEKEEENVMNRLIQNVIQTECLLIVKVEQTNFYPRLHSLNRKMEKTQYSNNMDVKQQHQDQSQQQQQQQQQQNVDNAMVADESKYVCVLRRSNKPLIEKLGKEIDEDMFEDEDEEEDADIEEDQTRDKSIKQARLLSLAQKKKLVRDILKTTKYSEIFSRPFLICMTFHDAMMSSVLMQDKLESHHLQQIIREQPFDCCIDFTDLLKVDRPYPNSSTVHFVFQTGEAIEVETLSSNELMSEEIMQSRGMSEVSTRRANMAVSTADNYADTGSLFAANQDLKLKTDRFLWAIIQLHALLVSTDEDFSLVTGVELQQAKNIDFQHLHYLAAVNGFLANHSYIFALI